MDDHLEQIADEVLEHYGVKRKSGRYPYGSGLRPYQSDPTKRMNKKEASKYEKGYDEYLTQLRDASKTSVRAAKELEQRKNAAMVGGSLKELLRFQQDMSMEELQSAFERVKLVESISKAADKDTKTMWDKINSASKNAGSVANALKTMSNIGLSWNQVWAVINGTTDMKAYEEFRLKQKAQEIKDAINKQKGIEKQAQAAAAKKAQEKKDKK